ncbi:MAG: molybdate ABC transporter permease subunit, partial [Lachnospira sp.]
MKYMTTDKTNKEPEFNGKKVKDRKVRVIPGFHLTLGITVTMLSLIVLIPLA